MRAGGRRARGTSLRPWSIEIELVPIEADELRQAASWTLAIGAISALTLLAVSIALVRRELRRSAEERERERERRLASLGEMSAVLAHEIRNPLASLKGNAQLLASSLDDKSRAKAQRVVDDAVRLERLTHDLLAFVRTGELARAPVAPAELVREAAAAVDPAIEVDAAAAPPRWSLDPARMREVVVNLLDNARSAGPPARASVRGERGRLVIEVCDRGPGVPAAERERIFEPFHTGKTHGTGLGLAIARRVVELHRGSIAVDDAPGGGARFRVEIPEA
jgi:two-component system sensor histidine kinase HydH